MKGKKGMGLSILAGIGFLLAVCLFLVISSNARILDRGAGNIGAIPLDVIRARYAGEQALLFLDYSAKYSLPYAILATGDSGGLADAPCGAYISSLWNTNVSICPPNVSSALKQAFDDRLHVYLNQYPNIPVHTYQYQIDSNNVKVSLLGFSSEDLIIPMTKTGTGFAELSDMGGGLVFPVEGNPIITSCFGDRILDSGPNNHDGLDFRTEQVNTKIFAIAPGQVVSVCEEWVGVCDCSVASSPKAGRACNPKNGCWMKCGNLGNTVLIKHAENFYSRYSHLSSVEVQVGDQISGGMFIAFSGDTGYSEAPHLDLKIYTTSDTSGKQGKNALCIYSDDQLATLTSSADSCKDEITGGKFSKANIRADCSRIEPEVYAQIAAFAVAEPKSEQAKEKTERSGRLRDSIVAKVNAYQDSISKYAAMAGIEEADLKAIMTHETVDIDPNAKSPSNPPALGLMQIVPKQNHDVCVRECGFSSKVDEQEYFNPDKNICCAAFIAKSKWREKPKKYGACCNKQGCVQEEREYVKREAMYRGYNGWGCGEWGDPNYVETLMSYYFFYGGNPSATYTPYKEQIGTYRVRPNFKTAYEYNLSVYDEVFQFVNDEILAKSNGTMVEEFLDEKMQAFNSTHTDLVMKRYCSDYPAAYQFAEEYVDCLLQEGDCVCNLLINIDLITIAYDLVLTNLSLQVRKAGGIASEYKIFFPEVFELLGYGQTQKDYFILSLDASGGNLEGTNAKEYFLEKKGDKLTLTRNWDASQLCKEKKEYYSLCVEDDSKIAHVSASFFSYAPVRMKFSIFLSQTISIESENPPSDSP